MCLFEPWMWKKVNYLLDMCMLEALCAVHYALFTNLWCGYYFSHFIDKEHEDHRLNNLPEVAASTWHQRPYFHYSTLLLELRVLKGRKRTKWEVERDGERSESFWTRGQKLYFWIMEPLCKLFCFRRILWLAKLAWVVAQLLMSSEFVLWSLWTLVSSLVKWS